MSHVTGMIEAHPASPSIDKGALDRCITECIECHAVCTSCADACLGEDKLSMLVRCIRLDLACADICGATGRTLLRFADLPQDTMRAQLESCAAICESCGAECEKHAQRHEHCQICAESCRRCEDACRELIAAL